jgi:hypothetical protein
MTIPDVTGDDWKKWARDLVYHLHKADDPAGQANVPRPVQLSHSIGDGNVGLERVTTDGILMYEPIEGMLMISVGGEWQYIFDGDTVASLFSIAAYGQMSSDTPTAGNDPIPLAGLWENVTVSDTLAPFNRGITFTLGAGALDPDIFVFDYAGIYQITVSGTLEHDQFPSDSRNFSVRVTNLSAGGSTPPVTTTIARNAGTTSFSLTALTEITALQIGDQFTLQIGNADNAITGVVWDRANIILNAVSEWQGPDIGSPTAFLGPLGFRKTFLKNSIRRP